MTYSIVARDPATGRLGVGVQSHYFAVGRIVPWAEAGVGAVATQSFAEPSYGPLGLDLMRGGATAPEALAELVRRDDRSEVRQVAMVDAAGNAAAHTGGRCVGAAGDVQRGQLSAQGNMMVDPACWTAMPDAFASAAGSFAERLLAALDAAEAAGGDVRGRQSAALLVVGGERSERPWEGVLVDVRADDHADPLGELRRLARYSAAYDEIGSALFTSGALTGEDDPSPAVAEEALRGLAAADDVLGGNPEAAVWRCVLLARLGRVDEARETIGRLARVHPEVAAFVARLPAAGLLPEGISLI